MQEWPLPLSFWALLPMPADALPGRDEYAASLDGECDGADDRKAEPQKSRGSASPTTERTQATPESIQPASRHSRYPGSLSGRRPQRLSPIGRPATAPPVLPRQATLSDRLEAEQSYRDELTEFPPPRALPDDLRRSPWTSGRPLKTQVNNNLKAGQWQSQTAAGAAPWAVFPGPGVRRLRDRLLVPAKARSEQGVAGKPFEVTIGRFKPAPGSLKRTGQEAPTPMVERPLSRLAK